MIITVKFITLGCKTNIYESEALKQIFAEKGYTIIEKGKADICVVNTCTVTGTGAAKSLKYIRRARRENPCGILAVMGCLAQTEAERLKNEENIDVLIGTKGRGKIVEMCEEALDGKKVFSVGDILHTTEYEELGIVRSQHRIRAEIKIADGCNNFCSYCKIPYARGPVRSRDIEKIAEEARVTAKEGYKEIVLTGIHIGSYGKDLKDGTSLIDVIERVSKEAEGVRIRLGSLEPVMITEEFTRRAKMINNLCPQFHLSLQSGCDKTLSDMRRHYTAQDFKNAVKNLRSSFKDAAVTTDLIVGFPGETNEDFEESKRFCEEIGFAQMHIFPYSVRKGTAAALLKDRVNETEKSRRTHIMLDSAAKMKKNFCEEYKGKTAEVLFEQKKDGMWSGMTQNYIEVRCAFDGDECEIKGKTRLVILDRYITEKGYMTGKLK